MFWLIIIGQHYSQPCSPLSLAWLERLTVVGSLATASYQPISADPAFKSRRGDQFYFSKKIVGRNDLNDVHEEILHFRAHGIFTNRQDRFHINPGEGTNFIFQKKL